MPSAAPSTRSRLRAALGAFTLALVVVGVASGTGRAASVGEGALNARTEIGSAGLVRPAHRVHPQKKRSRARSARARRGSSFAPMRTRARTASNAPTPNQPAANAPRVSPFGIAAGGNMHNLTPAALERELDDYRGVGSGWIRFDINWSLIQRGGPSSYEWEPFDRVVRAATARGLKVLAGVLYTPEWARPGTPDSTYAPFDLAAYASFCREAAKHYAPMGVHHWEVWNEPNIGFWKPAPDPARYAGLLKLAYPAFKQGDPQAFVITGGLSPFGGYGDVRPGHMNPLTFLEQMYAAGAAGSFDALGWHPYEFAGFGLHPMSAWSQLNATSPSVRSLMIANGDGAKQVWGTEYGVPTGGDGAVAESIQADMVAGAYQRWRDWSWSGPLFWFSYRNSGTNMGDREHNFGLVRADFSHKPAYEAYRKAAGSQ